MPRRSTLLGPREIEAEGPASVRSAPWLAREPGGLYVAWNRQVWLYRELRSWPLTWEDPETQLQRQHPLSNLLLELGGTSKDLGNGLRMLSRNREFHLVALSWDQATELPPSTPERLTDFLEGVLAPTTPRRAVLIGVKLRSATFASLGRLSGNPAQQVKLLAQAAASGEQADIAAYRDDERLVSSILARNDCLVPAADVLDQLESWFNYGNGPDTQVLVEKQSLRVGEDDIELSALMEFGQTMMTAPYAPWIAAALNCVEPACAVSIRGSLEPATVTRGRLRQAQRRVLNQIQEQAHTQDLERAEDAQAFQTAKAIEDYTQSTAEAFVTDCSILFGRRIGDHKAADTFADTLRNRFDIKVKPLEHRQLQALEEMLPCGQARPNPFAQDLTPSVLAYSGITGYSRLGDEKGVWLGLVDPDDSHLMLDVYGAPAANLPPAMAICGDPGSGKAQPLDARILTPTGWRLMGDLQIGDDVFGKDGQPHAVTGVFPQGVKDIYRVRFSDGTFAECCAEHLWAVRRSTYGSRGKDWDVRSTEDLLKNGLRDRDGKRRFHIPISKAVEFPAADVPLDPYLLGLLLGDGGLTVRVGFSTADQELADAVSRLIPPGHRLSYRSGYDYVIVSPRGQRNDVLEDLRDLGLIGGKAHEKFIPPAYLTGSVEQRWALLQGLLDTDGEANASKNSVEFTTTSPRLAEDVTDLARSLGCAVRRTVKRPRYTHNGEVRQGRLAYRLCLAVPGVDAPFRLRRKADAWRPRAKFQPTKAIDAIELVGVREAQCIMVDSDDHTYLTDDYIVTHNTFLAQLIAAQAALSGATVSLINPKGFDSLRPFATYVESLGVPSRVVSMSQLEDEGGYFDPFTFCEPEMAAEVAAAHIQTVLAAGLRSDQEVKLQAGLKRGAMAGARCVGDALKHVEDREVVRQVLDQVEGSTMFALGFAHRARNMDEIGGGLTLIEFDRDLDLPESSASPSEYTRGQRIALAAIRLVVRASMERMMRARGGVLIVDEAWTFLSSAEGLGALQRMGRLGRSLNLLPIFATQRIADIRDNALDGYLSRVWAMKLSDDREATAALQLVGLEPTRARLDLLKSAGPVRPKDGMAGRGALALHRDLLNRHALVEIGAGLPGELLEAFSTNPEDRAKRAATAQRRLDARVTPSAAFEGFGPFGSSGTA